MHKAVQDFLSYVHIVQDSFLAGAKIIPDKASVYT